MLVLEGIPVQGLPNSDREPIVLSGNEEDENVTSARVIDKNSDNISSNMIQFQDQQVGTSNKITNGKMNEHTAFIGGISGGLLSSCLSNGIQCTAVFIPASQWDP